MDYAYSLSSAGTGLGVTEWMNVPLIEMFEWGEVVSERQKQIEKEMRKTVKR